MRENIWRKMKTEIEIKFYPVDKDAVREKLRAAGFTMVHPEFLMTRIAFNNSILPGCWGRVRREFDKITMSIKSVKAHTIDGTLESEVAIDDFDAGVAFMETIGFKSKAYQETLREKWTRGDVGTTIDTWPGLEPCIEIEGETESAVYDAAADLGFDHDDAMFGAIDFVYEKYLGIPSAEICAEPVITFENPPKKK